MKRYISYAILLIMVSMLMLHGFKPGGNIVYAGVDSVSVKSIATLNDLNAVAWGNNRFVAVGQRGIIESSQDGNRWKKEVSGSFCDLNDIFWDGTQFIVVGSSGELLTSKDGTSWTRKTVSKNTLNGISFNGKIYVIVGNHGTIITSQNLQIWENSETNISFDFHGIACQNNLLIVVGSDKNTGVILNSTDGKTWVQSTAVKPAPLKSVIWGNGQFVAVEGNPIQSPPWNSTGTMTGILASKDNGTWTYSKIYESNKEIVLTSGINKVFWASGKYFAVGGNGTILSSGDGLNWNTVECEYTVSINGIAYNGDLYVAVGELDTVMNSKDGVEWTTISGGTQKERLNGIEVKGDRCVAVGDLGQILVSNNGEQWESINTGYKDNILDITWTGKQYIAVGGSNDGEYPVVLASKDGTVWTRTVLNQIAIGQDCWLNAVAWTGERIVAVGSSGLIMTSSDGVRWSEINSQTDNSLLDVVWNGKKLVAIGEDGTILTSPGGSYWNMFKNPHGRMPLVDVLWDGTRFVALGGIAAFSMVFTSADGERWTSCTDSEKLLAPLNGIAWNGKQLAAVGPQGTIMMSVDGVKWDDVKSDTENSLEDIQWDGEKYVAVGEKGFMVMVAPADIVKVKVDGRALLFDVAPRITNGRTLVPMRTIFESLGMEVKWDERTRSITANQGLRTIKLKVDSTEAYVDGRRQDLDVPATILNGRTFVPLRFISEGMGGSIEWNKETFTVSIQTN